MSTEHTQDHGSETHSCKLSRGIFFELPCENCVHSHDHIAKHVGYNRGASKADEILGHLTLREFDFFRLLDLE